jgi:2'-5' RNA ligase
MPHRLRRTRPPLPRFAVAWFPRFDGIDSVETFRRRHDPAAALIPAHVSLVFPFASAHSRLQIETHVRKVLSRWPPIPVTFRRVRIEANEFVFLMASRGAASIVALHDRLYTRSLAPHLRRDMPYEPHITLARYSGWPELEAAAEEAERLFPGEFTDTLREATLLRVEPDGRIERLKTIPLYTQ